MKKPALKLTIGDNGGNRRQDSRLILSKRHVHGLKPGDIVDVYFEDEYSRYCSKPREHHLYTVQKIEFVDAFTPLHYLHLQKEEANHEA